ncbi:hypothetical protein J6590_009093 [Homalodisca vitripennis]|nr:hypothetical protein J6590_009093 [Homalodisca vitripennis]
MSELKWNVDSVITFCNIFKTYSCLWDPSDENYNKRDARDVALKKLGSHLKSEGFGHINKDQFKIKIKHLKDSYRVELNKVKKSLKSGAGAEDIYKPKLGWFSVTDSFWRTVMMGGDSSSNLDLSQLVENSEEQGEPLSLDDPQSCQDQQSKEIAGENAATCTTTSFC